MDEPRRRRTVPTIIVSLVIFVGLVSALGGCTPLLVIGGPVRSNELVDGIYTGSFRNGPNKAVVKVTIQAGKIVEVELIRHIHWRGGEAEPVIPGRIIEKQSTSVDSVTGATRSSVVIMNATQRAIERASASHADAAPGPVSE